jgi:hypothetical protein
VQVLLELPGRCTPLFQLGAALQPSAMSVLLVECSECLVHEGSNPGIMRERDTLHTNDTLPVRQHGSISERE